MPRIVYGVNPVKELVSTRAGQVSVVYVAVGLDGREASVLRELCRNRQVTLEERERDELDALAGVEARHQGVVAIAGELIYAELEQVLEDAKDSQRPPLLVVLDGIQDPHNFGAIVRSSAVLGAHGVVIAKDRAVPVTPAVVKASAGATEHLPIARVTNLVRAMETIKEAGLWIVGAVVGAAPPPAAVDLKGPIALVVGAEGKGLRPLVERSCDHRVRIPMPGAALSLNVSVAAGILLYEVARQRTE